MTEIVAEKETAKPEVAITEVDPELEHEENVMSGSEKSPGGTAVASSSPEARNKKVVLSAKQTKKAEMRRKREQKREAKTAAVSSSTIKIKSIEEWIREVELAKVKSDLIQHFTKLQVAAPQQ